MAFPLDPGKERLVSAPTEQDLRLEDDGEGKDKEKKGGGGDLIERRMLESRTILVEGPVSDKMFRNVSSRLFFLEHDNPEAPITLVVNSPGGSADAGFAIYDLLKFIQCPVRTLVAGMSASAAVLISLGGDKGQRFMLPHSRFLLHQPSTSTGIASASDMEITAKEILRTRQKYAEVVAMEVNSDADKVMKDSNRDFWLDAEESKKYGLVDKIVRERKEMA